MERARAGALAAAWCCAGLAGQSQPTPDEALLALQSGNRRFAAGESWGQPLGEGLRRTLSSGQSPFAIVVTCADSSVPPEHVFDAGLGELFVIRVAGNVLDPESLASIEHAAQALGSPLCVVLAHSHCAMVGAAALEHSISPAMSRLTERLRPALDRARRDGLEGPALLHKATLENAHETVAECLRRSPVLRELVRLRRLQLHAATYDGASGEVEWLPDRPPEAAPSHDKPVTDGVVPGMPPHSALSMLRAGHRRFLTGSHLTAQLSADRRDQLLHGQRPTAVVLTCADSRVAPEHVFDAGLGDLYVVRVAGNVVSDEALASIEFAIARTGASLIVVMGHRRCAVLEMAAAEPDHRGLSASMLELRRRLEPSIQGARHEGLRDRDLTKRAEELNVLAAISNVRARSKLARQLEHDGRLALIPVIYELDTGDLRWLPDEPPPQLAPPQTETDLARAVEQAHESRPAPPIRVRTDPRDRTATHVSAAPYRTGDMPHPEIPGVTFDIPPAPGGAVAMPSGTPAPRHGQAALIGNLLIAFMVATAGVAVLLLVQRRRTPRAAAAES